MTATTKPEHNGFVINTNTVVGIVSTLVGGIVLYMVTTGMGQVKQTASDVKEVKTIIPYVQHAIDVNQADMKEALHDIKGDLKDVQTEQKQVRQDLMKQEIKKEPHE